MQKTVAQKMGIKAESRAFFQSAPDDALNAIDLPPVNIVERLSGSFDYIHLFASSKADMNKQLPRLKKHLDPKGVLWVSWPKNKQLCTDLTVKEVIRIGYEHGLVESTCLSINTTWSGLKFTFPKKGKVYNNKYGTLKHTMVLLICIWAGSCFAQHPKINRTAMPASGIPFQLTSSNNLAVAAVINQKDSVTLMFHTAADAVTITEAAMKKIKTLVFEGVDTVKSWGGGENNSRFSKNNLLSLGTLSWPNTPIWENTNSGPETDGKFGIDLFENKVIEINYDRRSINIYPSLPDTKGYKKFDLVFENDMMFLQASCRVGDSSFQNRFLIHSGYAGAILLDDQFATSHNIDQKLKITGEKELKDSFGNIIKTKKAILPQFSIGDLKLKDVPVGFFAGAIGRQKMSIIGGDLLKRFNMIIDADRQHIYLQASEFWGVGYSQQ